MRLENLYSIETPESISIDFTLAGPGTRFCATVVDILVLFLLAVLLFLVMILTSAPLREAADDLLYGEFDVLLFNWAHAFFIVAAFLLFSGYHLFLEWYLDGQTVGKRYLKIRVIRDDGTPMQGTDLFVRNLLRAVDFLPLFYIVGGLTSLFHPQHKRLGDIAAGTLVACEDVEDYRARTDKKYEVPTDLPLDSNPELSPKERQILAGFLNRREELLPESRNMLAEKIARPLHEKYGGAFEDGESFIERLLEGRHRET